ncbi:M48 family metalloprotease [Rhodobacteraceae bacterium]|nr:M48 family metalloprotease [Paracoccaceae bacterium]
MKNAALALSLLMALSACDVPTSTAPQTAPQPVAAPVEQVTRTGSPQSVADFRAVVRRVEPVAESACRQIRPGANCDFAIVIDDRPNQPPNAYQTYNDAGRPLLAFTPALLRQMRNRDEIAFALAHEAAHHIESHINQTQNLARTGAVIGAVFGAMAGLDTSGIDTATNIGGTIGARRYSKNFELEADTVGAQIAQRAGYNPLRGVLYFQDARDPGDRFLGSHPPNADRIQNVRNSIR